MKKSGYQVIIINPEGDEIFSTLLEEVNYGVRETINGDCIIISNKELTSKCSRCKGSGGDGYKGTNKCGLCSGTGYTDLYKEKL